MKKQKGALIVALDVQELKEAERLVELLSSVVDIFKIGSQLFTAYGPEAIEMVHGHGKRIFLDLKYHDIPNTVANAVQSAVGLPGLLMYTMHITGGKGMLQEAVDAGLKRSEELGVTKPLALGITVLTSEEKTDNIQNLILERAHLAKDSGLDGVVASGQDVAFIRGELGEEFIIVTPGIRPQGAEAGDQKRVATPAESMKNGSDYLVVGRPIVQAQDPLSVAKDIVKEIINPKP